MASPGNDLSRFAGLRYLGHGFVKSAVFTFHFNGVHVQVVVASPEDEAGGDTLVPPSYNFLESVEGKFLSEMSELSWGEFDEERDKATERLEDQLEKLLQDACLQTMEQLAPSPVPANQTLHGYLYPQTYALQAFTDFETSRLVCRPGDGHPAMPERHPPVSEQQLSEMGLDLATTDIPIVEASQVILVRRLQRLVWKVTVNGEEMICKASSDVFCHAVPNELQAYLKIRSARAELNVPELKGLVVSHRGVIGILLGYIPHKHPSLAALLHMDSVATGSIPPDENTASLRRKWATQIEKTLRGLHDLGILWRDLKTDNVLINEDGDAVLLDFGGGNTHGWVDHDKYGTMEGEEQGLKKIMEELKVAGVEGQ
ncbi:predicted protein [Chaetomium globosum CBS 148.51]|uniref:Protein kinase domain-containing protein n=1 Tax=Chaetomium globosum (strain ATCC 6205 / CBS 148.51 / DSM 1962 / NBRC 6347 / NRRL 1970) TaxID=306901 RepID=Q2H2D5_CHAGB|nr:uncharacterized protein CHGG_04061 [Chaetomium globosum CBS 148.51]EAQ87442.1 predicted protein [Chaetomium globosum CBS 148.51]